MAEGNGEFQFVLWTCAASDWRRSVQRIYAEEMKVHHILRVDLEQGRSEDTHRVILALCFHDLFAFVWDLVCLELRVGPDDVAVADV